MIKISRFFYFILIILVIILGISSRKVSYIPTPFGDVLYAVMIYFGMRFLYINNNLMKSVVFALVFCFSIEFLQLYKAECLIAIRSTTLGHYTLGQGFLWSDLVCYVIGIGIAFLIDFKLINKN